MLAIVEAGVASGLDARSAIAGLGAALAQIDPDGAALTTVAQRLAVGLSWEESWFDPGERLATLASALERSWRVGSSPVLALEAARRAERHRARHAAGVAAAQLGVRLTLPLALCMLPAFVLVGIVPLLLSIAAGVVGEVRA
jgi:hypothetical protein